MPLLEVIQMSHNFGGLQAVSNYNLQLDPGQITGLIGPNGAGLPAYISRRKVKFD